MVVTAPPKLVDFGAQMFLLIFTLVVMVVSATSESFCDIKFLNLWKNTVVALLEWENVMSFI